MFSPRFLALPLAVLAFASPAFCATTTTNFWCNERFLSTTRKTFDARHLAIAKRGYLYAVAAALALQKNDAEGKAYHFETPERMRLVDRPTRDRSGFEAATFELRDTPDGDVQSVVVAFTGSNDDTDWQDTNFGLNTRQYTLARRYLTRIASLPEYAGKRLVTTGFSLGGALAVHVTKHAATSRLVHETWAFNPSPRIWANGNTDKRIWLAAVDNEALRYARNGAFTVLPGIAAIGAPAAQTAEGFYLLNANPIVSHYRWVLTRNMLHVADLALRLEQGSDASTEPLEILQASQFRSCRNALPASKTRQAQGGHSPQGAEKS